MSNVQAHHKAQKQKEKAKNKKSRADKKTLAVVKQHTRDIETDIFELGEKEKQGPLSAADKSALESLKKELDFINKTKEKFLKDHPEQKNLVNRHTGVWPRALADAAKRAAEEATLLEDGFPPDVGEEFDLPSGPIPSGATVGPRIRALLGEPEQLPTISAPLLPNSDTSMPFIQIQTGGSASTIMAAPQLRDLKREAATFVPQSVKRQKA